MNYLRGYSILRNDPQFTQKLTVGSALFFASMIIPLIPQVVVTGYVALVARRAMQGIEEPLPRLDFDLNALGKYLSPGFKVVIARIAWAMPIVLLIVPVIFCLAFFPLIFLRSADATGLQQAPGLLFPLTMCCLYAGIFSLIMLMQVPIQVAVMRVIAADQLEVAFRFGEIFSTTKLIGKELIFGLLAHMFVSFCLTFLGLLACGIGIFPAIFAVQFAHAFFIADLYNLAIERGAPRLPLAPAEIA